MCRLYGHIAAEAVDPSDYLWQSRCSLLAQSTAEPNFKQEDGWGIAALRVRANPRGERANKGPLFRIFKSEKAVFKEAELWKNTARKSASKIVIAHLRAASNPLRLPKAKLIAPVHNQPFGAGRTAFAHNGSLNIAAAVRDRLLGPYRSKLQGRNDSEIYFWLFYKWSQACRGDVAKALRKTVKEIWTLWRSLKKQERSGYRWPYTGLNAVISDGTKLYALCHSIHSKQRLSLCLKDQPYNRLAYRMDPKRFIVSSEKCSYEGDWKVVPMHSLLEAEIKNGKIAYKLKHFQWK